MAENLGNTGNMKKRQVTSHNRIAYNGNHIVYKIL